MKLQEVSSRTPIEAEVCDPCTLPRTKEGKLDPIEILSADQLEALVLLVMAQKLLLKLMDVKLPPSIRKQFIQVASRIDNFLQEWDVSEEDDR